MHFNNTTGIIEHFDDRASIISLSIILIRLQSDIVELLQNLHQMMIGT